VNQVTDPCRIRPARAREAAMLSELAMRSKAHWGYSPAFMDACRAELTYSAAEIEDTCRTFAVAEHSGEPIGFYALGKISMAEVELEALFVEPDHIGTGAGRALMRHAMAEAARRGAGILVIQGDPNAAAFYEAIGAVRVGARESASIPGRMLPLYSVRLDSVERAAPSDAYSKGK
jgi:GNAT superfamily N-acetyltransferase